jgi:CHASE3 domain sensor protein
VLLTKAQPARWVKGAVLLLSILVTLLGGLILCQYFFDCNLGIDELLFRDPTPSVGTSAPGRTAPSTAFCMMLAGIGLFAACQSGSPRLRLSLLSSLGCALLAIGGIGCIGQTTDVLFGFSTWNYFGMAFHTAAGTALLGGGFFALSRSGSGIPWALERRVTLGFAAAVAILLTAAGCSWNYTHRLENASLEVGQTREVLKEIGEIRADRATAENNQRGFIILGDEKMLVARESLRIEILGDLANIRKLTLKNTSEQKMLDHIDALMTQRREITNDIITTRREKGFAAAQQMLASGPNLGLGAQIATQLVALRASEMGELAWGEQNVEITSTSTFLLLPVAVFLSLTLLSWRFFS